MIYVIKKWQVAKQADAAGNFVQINGRQEGLISWLLALIGIDPTVHLSVSQKNFTLEARTFWGFSKRVIPLAKVSEVQSGFARPWLEPIIFGILALCSFFISLGALLGEGSFGGFILMILFSLGSIALAAYIYVYKRRLVLGVVGFGGWPAVIGFRPSFIEGHKIDADAAAEVSRIIHQLVDLKN